MRRRRGRKRLESSFASFRNFIAEVEMGDIKFRCESWMWSNNREREGFIQERFDRFFGSDEWLLHFDKA